MSWHTKWSWIKARKSRLAIVALSATVLALTITLGVKSGKSEITQNESQNESPLFSAPGNDGWLTEVEVSRGEPGEEEGIAEQIDIGVPPKQEAPGSVEAAVGRNNLIDLTEDVVTCPATAESSQPFMVTDLANPSAFQIAISTPNTLCTLVRLHNPMGDNLEENTFLQVSTKK